MPNFFHGSKSVDVYNGDMTKLSPVSSGKARILLNKKKVKIISTNPIALRLNYVKRKTGEINV